MPRPVIVVVGWLAATAAAIAVAYAGVSAVAGRVVDPLPVTLGLQDVDDSSADGPTASAPGTDGSPASSTPDPADTTPPSPAATAAPESSPSASPQVPAQPTAEVRSYPLVGGNVTLRYEPGRVTVVSADAAQGFTQEIDGNGTAEVTVEFESDEHRSRLRGAWEDGPRDRVEEDDRSSGGSGGGGDDDDDDDHDDDDDD